MLTLYPHVAGLSLPDRLRIIAHHLRRDPADWDTLMEAADRLEGLDQPSTPEPSGEIIIETFISETPPPGPASWPHQQT